MQRLFMKSVLRVGGTGAGVGRRVGPGLQRAPGTAPSTPESQPYVRAVSTKHEVWRTEGSDTDNLPSVKRRDGTVADIEKARGFVDYARIPDAYRDPLERVFDWQELTAGGHDPVERTVQAARCMDCGTPFCQTHTGCPVNNLIPEWNDLVYRGQWRDANDRLHKVRVPYAWLLWPGGELGSISDSFVPEKNCLPLDNTYLWVRLGAPVVRLLTSFAPACPRRITFRSSRAWCARHRAREHVWPVSSILP